MMKRWIAARVLALTLVLTLLTGAMLPVALAEEVWNSALPEESVPELGEVALGENEASDISEMGISEEAGESSPQVSVSETAVESIPESPVESLPETPAEPITETPAEPTAETPVEPLPETPVETVPETPVETETPAEPGPSYEDMPEAGRVIRRFADMVEAVDETWASLDLARAEGYYGKLASVSGTLRLRDVTIEGIPAAEAELLDYFELNPGASVECSGTDGLALDVSALSMNKGQSRTLRLTWNGSSVSGKKASWHCSGSAVKVSKGKLTVKGKGRVTVRATYNGESAVCAVECTNFVAAKKVKFKHKSMELALNCEAPLEASISPSDADSRTISWTSSKPEVASVDENGVVRGLSTGSATVKATLVSGKSASCTVTVRYIRPTAIGFSRAYVTMKPGDSFTPEIKWTPENVTDPGYVLSSQDPAVCAVNEQGEVVATGLGTTDLTVVSTVNEKVKGTCRVTVLDESTARFAGLTIGINPGHQRKTIKKGYPIAPWSTKKAKGVKTGACGHYTRVNEYETVLQIGLKLKRILEEQGATVVITRTTNDVMLTNIDRAKILNDANVDVALQLHCNTSHSSSHKGNSGYIRTTGDWVEESRAIAGTLTHYISEICDTPDLGVKIQNEFMSLNWTTTPSVLLEMGYLTNRTEDHLLATDEYREKMAYAISEGLAAYYGR